MSSSSNNLAPLQSYHVRNIIHILRRANAHYTRVASRIRATLVPTHHARKRARHIGLTVDVAKAIACEQRQISIVPLPVLDISQTPVSLALPAINARSASVHKIITKHAEEPYPFDENLQPANLPTLGCVIPPAAVVTYTTSNGTINTPADHIKMHATSGIQLLSPLGEDCHYLMDISMDHEWQPNVLIEEDSMVETDVRVLENMSDSSTTSPSSSAGCAFNSSSSTDTSLSNEDLLPLINRIKRKSAELAGSTADNGVEKRLKSDRRGPAQNDMHRRGVNFIRNPLRR